MGISQLVVWNPLFLDPSDGVFGSFELAALCGCHTLTVCLFVSLHYRLIVHSTNVACMFNKQGSPLQLVMCQDPHWDSF